MWLFFFFISLTRVNRESSNYEHISSSVLIGKFRIKREEKKKKKTIIFIYVYTYSDV